MGKFINAKAVEGLKVDLISPETIADDSERSQSFERTNFRSIVFNSALDKVLSLAKEVDEEKLVEILLKTMFVSPSEYRRADAEAGVKAILKALSEEGK